MIAELTIQKKVTKYFDDRILFVPVHHGETKEILGCSVTFFRYFSTKSKAVRIYDAASERSEVYLLR